MSSSSNRSNPTPLVGKTVSGNIYASPGPDSGVYKVRFYLDDPNMSATLRRTKNSAPYDFAGEAASTASPFDTREVSNGSHTITAAVRLSGGDGGGGLHRLHRRQLGAREPTTIGGQLR